MKPLFNIGTKVTIKDIGDDESGDYPFAFVKEMQEYKNQTFEIIGVRPSDGDYSTSKYYDEYDGWCYSLNIPGHWSWSSPMFQEAYEL